MCIRDRLCIAAIGLYSCDPANEDNNNDQNVDNELLSSSAQIDFVNELDFTTSIEVANENEPGRSISNERFGPFDCAVITCLLYTSRCV